MSIFMVPNEGNSYELATARHSARDWQDPLVAAEERDLQAAEEAAREAFRELERKRNRARLNLYLERYVSPYERDILELTRLGCPQLQVATVLGRTQPAISNKLAVLKDRFDFLDRWPGTGLDSSWVEWQLTKAGAPIPDHFAALIEHNGSRERAATSLGTSPQNYKLRIKKAVPELEKRVRQVDTPDLWRVWDSILPLLNRRWRLTTPERPPDHQHIEAELQDMYDELARVHRRRFGGGQTVSSIREEQTGRAA